MKGARMLDHRLPAPVLLLMSLCIFVFSLCTCIYSYDYVFLFVFVTALIDLASDVAFHIPLEAAHKDNGLYILKVHSRGFVVRKLS